MSPPMTRPPSIPPNPPQPERCGADCMGVAGDAGMPGETGLGDEGLAGAE